ncbi:WD repeat protein Lub1 [Gurleya vavrai]
MLNLIQETKFSSKDLRAIAINKENLAVASTDGIIYVKNHTSSEISKLTQMECRVSSLIFNNNDLFAGYQNGLILLYKDSKQDQVLYFTGHSSNVCSLDVFDNFLISSSWDNSIRIWDINLITEIHKIQFECCVWSVKFIDKNLFVACLADKTIKTYKNKILEKTFVYHLSAVRGCFYLKNDFIYSIGNDGKVIKSDMNGKIKAVCDLKEFSYTICGNENNILVGGENGNVSLLDKNLNLIQNLKISMQSVWTSFFYNKKFYIAGSNGFLLDYENKIIEKNLIDNKSDSKDQKSNVELKENKIKSDSEDQKNTAKLNDNNIEFEKKSDSEDQKNTAKLNDKNFENKSNLNDQKHKVENGKVYFNKDGQWVLIGDVIENNEKFDYTFDVEVDGKVLKLSFNENDNLFDVADNFITKNELSREFKDDIVNFIKKNYRPKNDLFVYREINLKGIKKYLNDEFILQNLEEPKKENNEELEKRLKEFLKQKENFYVLDCYKYFVSKGLTFNFLFLQDYDTNEKKNATVFMRLLTNLYVNQPFNLEIFDKKVKKIIDYKIVDQETIDNFKKNRDMINK